jgi:hypothetical protein
MLDKFWAEIDWLNATAKTTGLNRIVKSSRVFGCTF